MKLKQGSNILLKEIMNKALSSDHGLYDESQKLSIYNAKNALKEFGIAQLNAHQAREILNLRSDFIE